MKKIIAALIVALGIGFSARACGWYPCRPYYRNVVNYYHAPCWGPYRYYRPVHPYYYAPPTVVVPVCQPVVTYCPVYYW